MSALNSSANGKTDILRREYVFAVLLGVGTFLTFGVERALYVVTGQQLGDMPAIVMGVIAIAVGLGAFYTSMEGDDVWTAVVIALGPVGGLALYLFGYHLLLPPSTESPTWLIVLAFAAGFIMLGGVAHLVGRLTRAIT